MVYHQVYWDLSMSPYAYIPFAILYSIIFIVGLAGNIAVIYVTIKNRSLQVSKFDDKFGNKQILECAEHFYHEFVSK